MFERFDDAARKAVVLAQEEARRLRHGEIDTGDLLLGLLGEGKSLGAAILQFLGVGDEIRSRIDAVSPPGKNASPWHIPFDRDAKRVLQAAVREAKRMKADPVGTQHLLLALIREGGGTGARVLGKLRIDRERVRTAIVEMSDPGRQD
jgi:ATP-dependent Clp protease ATP-binding subunit ClpC